MVVILADDVGCYGATLLKTAQVVARLSAELAS